jgi:hypothetical protein
VLVLYTREHHQRVVLVTASLTPHGRLGILAPDLRYKQLPCTYKTTAVILILHHSLAPSCSYSLSLHSLKAFLYLLTTPSVATIQLMQFLNYFLRTHVQSPGKNSALQDCIYFAVNQDFVLVLDTSNMSLLECSRISESSSHEVIDVVNPHILLISKTSSQRTALRT